jgi:2,3-bisphosphoglycerate-dependent phosphoglycerate mutase
LAPKGIEEAKAAGKKLKEQGLTFDLAFTSSLKRAQNTLDLALAEMGLTIPITKNQALNERMYGDLQGLDKDETRKKYGDEQVKIWRRSYDIQPPNGESLKDTADRVIPYFEKEIAPLLKQGKNIIIAAHGNSLRALIMKLENLSPEQILEVEIPTGKPKLYDLNSDLSIIKAEFI